MIWKVLWLSWNSRGELGEIIEVNEYPNSSMLFRTSHKEIEILFPLQTAFNPLRSIEDEKEPPDSEDASRLLDIYI